MYMYNVEELIAMAAEKRASDVHLIAGLPPKCRIDGQIVNLADVPLSKEDCDTYGLEVAVEHIKKIDSTVSRNWMSWDCPRQYASSQSGTKALSW